MDIKENAFYTNKDSGRSYKVITVVMDKTEDLEKVLYEDHEGEQYTRSVKDFVSKFEYNEYKTEQFRILEKLNFLEQEFKNEMEEIRIKKLTLEEVENQQIKNLAIIRQDIENIERYLGKRLEVKGEF